MAKFNKTQRKIVVAAAVLIILACLFPPYREGEVNDKGELTGWHVKWEFDKNLRDLINPPVYVNPNTGAHSIMIWEYMDMRGLQHLEILGILVLAGAGFLISKNKQG